MDLFRCNDTLNYYRLGFNLSALKPGEVRLESLPSMEEPDPEDMLRRTFMVFILRAAERTGIAVQPGLYEHMRGFVSKITDAEEIFNQEEEIKEVLAAGNNIPLQEVQCRQNYLLLIDEAPDLGEIPSNVRTLTPDDIPHIQKLVGGGPFYCPPEPLEAGYVNGWFEGDELAAVSYTLPATPNTSKNNGEILSVFTKEEYRGKGYMKFCLYKSILAIKKNGKTPMYGCRTTNTPSFKLAQSVGFKLISRTLRFWRQQNS